MDKENTGVGNENRDWFSGWFGTEYYNLLYRERSDAEAVIFIDALRKQSWFRRQLSVLDLGCGNGRHALALSPYVSKIIGLDISEIQLGIAEKSKTNQPCEFVKADMRDFHLDEKFDLILNVFTSFGYFDSINDNLLVLQRVHDHLRQDGRFVLDYLNAEWVLDQLKLSEETMIDGVEFRITRTIRDNRIHKVIKVAGSEYEERVTLFHHHDLKRMMEGAQLSIDRVCGSYHLDDFDAQTSSRCIIFARLL